MEGEKFQPTEERLSNHELLMRIFGSEQIAEEIFTKYFGKDAYKEQRTALRNLETLAAKSNLPLEHLFVRGHGQSESVGDNYLNHLKKTFDLIKSQHIKSDQSEQK